MKILVITIALLVHPFALAEEFCSESNTTAPAFKAHNSYKEKKLDEFANSKEIAAMSDQMLNALTQKKSPVLVSWIKRRDLGKSDDKTIIRAWRRYFAENLLIRGYAKKNPKMKNRIEKTIESIYSTAFTSEQKKHFDKVFLDAQRQALTYVKNSPLSEDSKKQVLNRISNIKLHWLEKLNKSNFKQQPLEVLSWGIAYSPVTNEINMGLNALKYKSKATLFAVFAHEIGHSFDPCRWGAFFSGTNPFQKINNCLRSKESVGALPRDDSQLENFYSSGKISLKLKAALELHPTCNKIEYPPIGLQSDQIHESFADWFSTEVIANSEYLKSGFRNDLCVNTTLNKGSSYPPNLKRLLRIYLAHPKIQKSLKIKLNNSPKYCHFAKDKA